MKSLREKLKGFASALWTAYKSADKFDRLFTIICIMAAIGNLITRDFRGGILWFALLMAHVEILVLRQRIRLLGGAA